MESNAKKKILTDKEAAQYIGMSESWLRISRMKGGSNTPPFIKISHSVWYLQEDLDNWLVGKRKINTLGG